MKPIKFEGQNVVFAEDQPEFEPLPAKKDADGTVTTCWEFTPEEREIIANGGNLYLSQLTFNHPLQPLSPSVGKEQ